MKYKHLQHKIEELLEDQRELLYKLLCVASDIHYNVPLELELHLRSNYLLIDYGDKLEITFRVEWVSVDTFSLEISERNRTVKIPFISSKDIAKTIRKTILTN